MRRTNMDIVLNRGTPDLEREFERVRYLFSGDTAPRETLMNISSLESCFSSIFSQSVYSLSYAVRFDVLEELGVMNDEGEYEDGKVKDIDVFLGYIEYVMSALYTLNWLDVYNKDSDLNSLRVRLTDETFNCRGGLHQSSWYRGIVEFDYRLWFRVWDKCCEILDKLGYVEKVLYREGRPYVVVVRENPNADYVESVEPDLAHSLRVYRSVKLKGDLETKAEILCTLYKDIERELPAKEAKSDKYLEGLRSDFTNVCNTSGIRHGASNNKPAEKFSVMSDDELEVWYDNAYTMYLHIKTALLYRKIHEDLTELKKD